MLAFSVGSVLTVGTGLPFRIDDAAAAPSGATEERKLLRELAGADRDQRTEILKRLRSSDDAAWATIAALKSVGVMEDRLAQAVGVRDKQGAKMYAYYMRRVAKASSQRSEFTEFRAMEIENRNLCGDVQKLSQALERFQGVARTTAATLVDRPDVLTPVTERVRALIKTSRRASRRGALLRSLDGHLVRMLAADLNTWSALTAEREVVVPAMRLLARVPELVDVALIAPGASYADPVVRRTTFRLLAAVGSAEAVDVLVGRVAVEEGVPARDLLWYLRELSGKEYGDDPTAWQEWWEAYRPGWQRSAGEIAAVGEVERPTYSRYFGLELQSARVLFVIDRSGSMSYWIGFKGGMRKVAAFREPDKMTVATRELRQAVGGLDERVSFNILAYGNEFDAFVRRPVRATDSRRKKVATWIGKLKPGGSTNLAGTLLEAMASTRPGKAPRDEAIADTIVVLSDGAPNCGPIAYDADILAELRRLNSDGMVTIHAIFLGVDGDEGFMRSLANDHGGKFVHHRQ